MGFFDPFGGSGSSGGSGGTIVPGNYATKAELTSEAEKRASADKELQTEIKANAESVPGLEKSVEELQTSKANADDVYNKEEADSAITAKVSEIVAGAPEDFNTLKEMSDWLTEHEDSAAAMNTAIQTNTKTIADNATAIEGNTADIKQNKNDIAVNRSTLGTQCKNIINNNRTSGTSGGLTITVNEDKSVTFNGTATENVYYWVYGTGVSTSNQKKLPKGTYVLTGCPKDGTQETYSLAIGYRQSPTSERYAGYDIGNGYKLNMNSDTGSVDILIQIRTGTIVDNLTFYPMLRPADITDNTYEAYIPSVAEQFATVKSDIAVNCTTLGAQHKNLFNKDGDINYVYNGGRPADQKWYSTVSGNVITVRAPLTLTNIAGQFIPKAKGKKIILSGKLLSINSSNSADMLAIRAYTRNVPAPIFNTRTNNIGEFSCKIDCEEYDEVFVCFGLWYGDGTAEIENIMVRYADITDDTYEAYVPSVNERLVEVENNKMGYKYGYAYAKNDTNVGWFKVARFSCPATGSTLRRATFFVTGVGASNTGVLSVQATSVTGNTPGIGAIACSWAYNQLTTSGGKYITNIPVDSFKAIGNLDGDMIHVELWCRIDNAYFVLKSRLLNFESRTNFLPVSEVEMYSSSTATTEEPTGAVNTISSYKLRAELDSLTTRITALETALSQMQTE